ncbi:thioredoxin domain-containing protein [Sphingobacterium sp. BN32]|uniref:thioredoxin family protein n=1 Tax=Sphingobacterium sp. BN32 TaxID=3058432 RepID=UPI00265D3430|nr:thioredoxin domain-containing protein [Sphingobacterium sp. BN32]WKK59246.1 thioredoxin domain-containing protein [Sphingobacterium sp. BN32]
MKLNLSIFLIILFFFQSVHHKVFAQGINFEESANFRSALDKAKTEKKIIFVDFLTDWCGPCKRMAANVFTRPEVGEVFNANFINLKIDAEKGEGPELAKKYGVRAYPTMAFITYDGVLMHSLVGSKTAEQLIQEAEKTRFTFKHGGLKNMESDFRDGKKDLEFLTDFYATVNDPYLKSDIAARYLLNLPETDFLAEEGDQIYTNEEMIRQISTYNHRVFNRMLELIVKKKQKEENFSRKFRTNIVFSIELTMGKIMDNLIYIGDDKTFQQALEFHKRFKESKVSTASNDQDLSISSGRGIFFASEDFLQLQYLSVNDNNRSKFKPLLERYMTQLILTHPLEEVEAQANKKLKLNPSIANNETNANRHLEQALGRGNLSSRNMLAWIDYYWRISDNKLSTKKRVGNWLNYACTLNPFQTDITISASPILVKVGAKDNAIKHLNRSINAYSLSKYFSRNPTKALKILIEKIDNNKI